MKEESLLKEKKNDFKMKFFCISLKRIQNFDVATGDGASVEEEEE